MGRSPRQKVAQETSPLQAQDWVQAAIVLLAEDSVDALRVDELAKRLGVTKGSFYWHFDSRERLLQAVLETWRARTTGEIETFIKHSAGSPAGRIGRLLRIAIRNRPDVPGGPLELSLRDWARRDERVRKIIEEVDAERIAVLVRLYRDAGLGEQEAADAARAQMAYTIGARMLLSGENRAELENWWRVGEALFVPSTPSE